MFHVGQLVQAIRPSWSNYQWSEPVPGPPVKGSVYRVRSIISDGTDEGLRLEEIVCRTNCPTGDEPSWWSGGFRPVDETKLSVFQAMLVSPPKETVTIGQD